MEANSRVIIPISKLLGNYNNVLAEAIKTKIIPISKLLGNYNILTWTNT